MRNIPADYCSSLRGSGKAVRQPIKRAILLTSNQSLGAWGEVFGDSVIASAILDHLLHHSITVNIRGDSYRLKKSTFDGHLQ